MSIAIIQCGVVQTPSWLQSLPTLSAENMHPLGHPDSKPALRGRMQDGSPVELVSF